ncbi:HU family DNA-binding protein [Candidatus Woesearchaeota archaeon]|nr:HU family DNA-binding protein [Candidatus Woesearchaeota archaeon]
MNYQDLTQKISAKFHLRRSFSKKLLDLISSEITQELRREKRVYLRALGVFHPIQRPARRYYDLKTKKIKIKPSHKDIVFRPGKHLLRQITRSKKSL